MPPPDPHPEVPMDAMTKKLAAALDALIDQMARELDDYARPLRAIQKVLREIAG